MEITKRSTAIVSFVAVLAGTVALNAVLGLTSRSVRIDCTEERLYTLSSGVKELVRGLDEPVKVDLYWSASVGNDVPQLRTYAQRVSEFLTELASASGGNLRVRQTAGLLIALSGSVHLLMAGMQAGWLPASITGPREVAPCCAGHQASK